MDFSLELSPEIEAFFPPMNRQERFFNNRVSKKNIFLL